MITKLVNLARDNAPYILTGMSIFGIGWTAVEAVKATPKALDILEKEEVDPKKEPVEAIKATWKCYKKPGGIFLVTVGCVLGIPYWYEQDRTKLIGALAYSEAKRLEYQESSRRVFGEQAEAIDQDIKDHRMPNDSDIPTDPLKEGKMWCYEPESKQWIQTSSEEINYVELVANRMFARNGKLTFNQFLDLFQNAKRVDFGDHFGWYRDDPDGYYDYNWSYYPGGTPWIDIQPQIDKSKGILILAYGMHPGDDLDCNDIDEPEQFEIR